MKKLSVGQKVAYPNQGVCEVEEYTEHKFGKSKITGYTLRVMHDGSTIFVPEENADSVGIRPLINKTQCSKLLKELRSDFEPFNGDWKARSKLFTDKLRSGDIFETAEVLKMLTHLSHGKKLSFREQTLLERSKFLIVSELAYADLKRKAPGENEITEMVEAACNRLESSAQAAAPGH